MRFGIIYYKDNIAGKNIVDCFRKISFSPQIPIIELKKETLYSEINYKKYPELKNIEFLFFASTHKSKKGDPSLCLHVAGNWREAEYGGEEGKVCMSSAFVMKYLFQQLNKNAKNEKSVYEKYKISMEATHHGPLVSIPSCFIELGSLEEEWRDKNAAEVIAKTILSLEKIEYNDLNKNNWKACIAVGGGHYCLNFNKLQLNSDYAIGHVIPDYSFPINEQIIKEAEKNTKENIIEILIDNSIKSEEKQKILYILEKLRLKHKK
ncbi:MAG: D-aminoacyl-tRNA deacylase [Nanoarchaeota archaeon]